MTNCNLNSVVVVSPNQVSSEVAGEVIILELKRGVYHGLESTGARIWQLIQQPRQLAELRDLLVEEYEVDADTCAADLISLMEELAANGLAEVRNGEAA